MSRKRSTHICEKCGKQGFKRTNPEAVVHYDSKTGKRKTCFVVNILKRKKNEQQKLGEPKKRHFSAEVPPKQFWGESTLYNKIGDIANCFHSIGRHLEKVQKDVYQYKPDPEISSKCVDVLELFEKHFLNPVEKILVSYHDKRVTRPWSSWFKVQMDSLNYGYHGAAKKKSNLIPTGEWIYKKSEDPNFDVEIIPIGQELSSSQVKRKFIPVLKFASELLAAHPLNMALEHWSKNTIIEEIENTPEDFWESIKH